uniref:Uncharacterized protein n=1 Tax=viral metagenome TaxID=1070528 RepID=A0A6H1ZQG3_9ZZZZ
MRGKQLSFFFIENSFEVGDIVLNINNRKTYKIIDIFRDIKFSKCILEKQPFWDRVLGIDYYIPLKDLEVM